MEKTKPKHYDLNPEPIDVISSWELNFNLGNVIKYVARAGKKDGENYLDDLEKAKAYLEREIGNVEKKENNKIDFKYDEKMFTAFSFCQKMKSNRDNIAICSFLDYFFVDDYFSFLDFRRKIKSSITALWRLENTDIEYYFIAEKIFFEVFDLKGEYCIYDKLGNVVEKVVRN